MTKDEAKTIEDAARKWADYACQYELAIVLNQDHVPKLDVGQQEQEFFAQLNEMTNEEFVALVNKITDERELEWAARNQRND